MKTLFIFYFFLDPHRLPVHTGPQMQQISVKRQTTKGSWPGGFSLAMALSRVYLKLHSPGQLLAARIGILPFFFLKSIKKETKAIEEELKGKMRILTAKSSSVDRSGGGVGGGLAFHWHEEYARYPVFITFETNFLL